MTNKIQFTLIFIALPIIAALLYAHARDVSLTELIIPTAYVVHIGDVPLQVEVADTEEARLRGLSGRESLSPNTGLLFVFDTPGPYGIWMKDMQFPIDVIWVSENLRVVDIEERILPETYPRSFTPEYPAKYIIETNANYVDSFDITVGDTVTLPIQLTKY